MERTRSRRRLYAVLTTMALMLSAFAGISVADSHNNNGNDNGEKHCPDHRDNPTVEAQGDPAQADETITVDGQEVRVVVDGDTVNFYDEDGNPISVEFCIAAAQDNSGPQEGHEGHVTWTNRGGNTPDISYVVVYAIVDDDTDPDDGCPPEGEVGDISLEHADGEEDPATNEPGDEHTVTATVTDADGNPCPDVDVRFEVTGDGNPTPDEGSETTDDEGEADFSFNNDEEGENTVTACTNDDGSAPESCDEADHSASVTKIWEEDDNGPPPAALCRQQTVNLIDETLVLFEANENGEPCVTEDGSLLNEDQIRLVRSETNEDDTSATGEVVGVGGPGDPGGISLIGTRTDCDEQDAYVLLLSAGGEEQLRLSGEDDPLPNLAMDDENGIFFTRTSGEEGKGGTAEAVAVTLQGTDLVVLSKAESRC